MAQGKPRPGILGACLLLGVVGWVFAQPAAKSALEEVRDIMQAYDLDVAEREQRLRTALDRLQTTDEIQRALALCDWQDRSVNHVVAEADASVRTALISRFDVMMRGFLRGQEESSRLATINMILETGASIRRMDGGEALMRRYGPDLAEIVKYGTPEVRIAGVRALGRITPEPSVAVPVVDQLLQSHDHGERVAAAEACQNLMIQVWSLATRNKSMNGVEYSRADVIAMACALLPVARRGLNDAHPEVRCRCLDTLRTSARALDGFLASAREEQERLALVPWVEVMQDQVTGLTQCQKDFTGGLRLGALQTIDCVARAQAHLVKLDGDRRSRTEVTQAGFSAASVTDLKHGLTVSVRALSAGLQDPEVRIRRFAVDALEPLGPQAVLATPQLLKALDDQDTFVRWAATRTLGKIGASDDPQVANGLTKVLADSDMEIRRAAAQALELQGPAACVAVPILIRLVETDTPDLRIAAMRVLRQAGPESLKAMPSLMQVLEHDDPRVRQQAAETLGKMGPTAKAAEPALRHALSDLESNVRHAAAAALINIAQPAFAPNK